MKAIVSIAYYKYLMTPEHAAQIVGLLAAAVEIESSYVGGQYRFKSAKTPSPISIELVDGDTVVMPDDTTDSVAAREYIEGLKQDAKSDRDALQKQIAELKEKLDAFTADAKADNQSQTSE